jgi:hypothetical protein
MLPSWLNNIHHMTHLLTFARRTHFLAKLADVARARLALKRLFLLYF